MSEEYRKLEERIDQILKLIKRHERNLQETKQDLDRLYVELTAAKLQQHVMHLEGDNGCKQ